MRSVVTSARSSKEQAVALSLHVPKSDVAADAGAFRAAMRQLPGGVAIITAADRSGAGGMTVTSLVSLSVDPPSIMVAINRSTSTWPLIAASGAFGANILAADDVDLADRFSGKGGLKGTRRFEPELWSTLSTGAPILVSALVALDCRVERIIEHHTHAIVIGRVVEVRATNGRDALAYRNGSYVAVGDDDLQTLADACFGTAECAR